MREDTSLLTATDSGLAADFWTLHGLDARHIGDLLASNPERRRDLVTTTITSPPYGSLKNYGATNQIGFGQSYAEYLNDMQKIFAEIHAWTTEDGSLWIIADTYIADGPPPRKLLPVPFDLAGAAESSGWTLRDTIIWQKDRTLPWSNGTRLRNAFEYVLLLVKGPAPKYRLDRLREHADLKDWWIRFPERYNPAGKAPSNVWSIPIPKQGSWGNGEMAHACPLPPSLVERLILLSSDEGDVVLDPFAGSGVVIAEAERLNRRGLGSELVKRHIDEFARIVRPEVLGRKGPDVQEDASIDSELLISLRMLKLPVVLMRKAARRTDEIAWPLGVLVLPGQAHRSGDKHGSASLTILFKTKNVKSQRKYVQVIRDLLDKPPASKFGIDANVHAAHISSLPRLVSGRKIFSYKNGNTSRSTGSIRHNDLESSLYSALTDSVPPVLSSIFVDAATAKTKT